MPKQDNVLILGSASWLGSILISKQGNGIDKICGTYFNTKLFFDSDVTLIYASTLEDYKNILRNNNFTTIINFLRGEDEEGLAIHEEMIKYCENNSAFYVYCSSALALDAYRNSDLEDSLLAKSKSPYGKFKANCERRLYESKIDWCILRFSSLQGYCEHKPIRNEIFLSKLKKGAIIKVDKNIIQNRMFADDVVDLITKIILNNKNGIIHLGTSDSSDEIDFLKKQASLFGYSEDRVVSSQKNRDVNLNCIPSRLDFLDSIEYPYTEETTLKKIFQINSYSKYTA